MRTVLALLVVLGLMVAGALFWAGRQAGELPDWYAEARAAGTLEEDLVAAGRRATQSLVGRFGKELLDEVTADDGTPDESFLDRIKRRGKMVLEGLREGREVRLDARDLENLVLAWAADQDEGRELLTATRAVRAEISATELEMGVVVLPAQLPPELLAAGTLRLIDRLARLSGSDGEVYVGLRAVPGVAEERLVLGPPVVVKVGRLELGSDLLAGLGVDIPELGTGVAVDLGQVTVRQATIEGGDLVLIVSPQI